MRAYALLILAAPFSGCGAKPVVSGEPDEAVSLTPAEATVFDGAVARFHANLDPVSTQPLIWSVTEPSGGTVDATGYYQAPSIPGTYTVNVTVPSSGAHAYASAHVVATMPGGGDLVRSSSPLAKVAPTLRVHAIWWGDPAGFPPDAQQSIENMISSLQGTPYLGILDQYLDGSPPAVEFAGSWHDTARSPPNVQGSPADVVTEISLMLQENDVPDLSEQDLFIVYPSIPSNAEVANGAFCGWHSFSNFNGRSFLIAYVASPAGSGGICGASATQRECSSTSAGTSLMTSTTIHELFETFTNGWFPTWIDANRDEIADKCDIPFCLRMGASVYALQAEYSNAAHGCVASN